MSDKDEVQVSSHRSKTNAIIICFEVIFICVMAGVLIGHDDDCDRPIRLWLEVLWVVYAIHSLILILTEVIFAKCQNICIRIMNNIYVAGNCIMGPFMLVWFIMGNIWLYESENCSNDWTAGWRLSLVIMSFHYVLFALIFIIGLVVCILICIGNAISARANYKTI